MIRVWSKLEREHGDVLPAWIQSFLIRTAVSLKSTDMGEFNARETLVHSLILWPIKIAESD